MPENHSTKPKYELEELFPIDSKGCLRDKTPNHIREKVCRLYLESLPIRQITKECGVSPSHIYSILKTEKINLQGLDRYQRDKGPCLSQEHMEIINGSLLGDGSIDNLPKGNSQFIKVQKCDRLKYIEWHQEKLLPIKSTIQCRTFKKPIIVNGKITTHPTEKSHSLLLRSQRFPCFTELRRKWYPDNKKIVPDDIVLTPLVLAIWFCDDGCNYQKGRRITFSTHCFSLSNVEMLCSKLNELGFPSHPKSDHRRENQFLILISQTFYKDFVDFIKPFVTWECFQYKVSLSQYKAPGPRFNARLTKEDILEIRKLFSEGWSKSELDKKFKLKRGYASAIINRKHWANI